ncbi:hypothetical protein AVEN_249295-1 [Araneus ventricosus]|uniref:Uncharacterized protein n=1 Tax=Araneus ventricosus TaxID=182803 RepID=A0A4Y2A6U8_ARAVE|nr:hypothetical protein AVEN_249295-1 [Araneus ventricosus]
MGTLRYLALTYARCCCRYVIRPGANTSGLCLFVFAPLVLCARGGIKMAAQDLIPDTSKGCPLHQPLSTKVRHVAGALVTATVHLEEEIKLKNRWLVSKPSSPYKRKTYNLEEKKSR